MCRSLKIQQRSTWCMVNVPTEASGYSSLAPYPFETIEVEIGLGFRTYKPSLPPDDPSSER